MSAFTFRHLCRRGMATLVVATLAILAPASPVSSQEQPAAATDDRVAQLERQVAELAERLAELRAELAASAADAAPAAATSSDEGRLAELERQIELLAGELERLRLGEATATAEGEGEMGFGPAASKIYRTESGLSIGGYGELAYQNFDGSRDDGAASGRTDEFDMLRAIVYFGYKFDDKWLFNSEIEYEHGNEIFVEFAYLDYLWREGLGLRFGHLLAPMGLVNELHEPTTFHGVLRPRTETVIIPSTWHENGLGVFGETGTVSYRAYVMNGLKASGFGAGGLRGGRQKGSKAAAEDLAFTGRVDVTPLPGLLVGGSLYSGGSGQGIGWAGETLDVDTTIYELHADWRWQGLALRGLATWAELDDVAELNQALGKTGAASIGEEMEGWYVEAAYDVFARRGGRSQLSPFVRLEQLDTQSAVPAGFAANPANDQEILTIGIDYKPIPQLVFKADWQDVDDAAGTGVDQINAGFGWVF